MRRRGEDDRLQSLKDKVANNERRKNGIEARASVKAWGLACVRQGEGEEGAWEHWEKLNRSQARG